MKLKHKYLIENKVRPRKYVYKIYFICQLKQFYVCIFSWCHFIPYNINVHNYVERTQAAKCIMRTQTI